MFSFPLFVERVVDKRKKQSEEDGVESTIKNVYTSQHPCISTYLDRKFFKLFPRLVKVEERLELVSILPHDFPICIHNIIILPLHIPFQITESIGTWSKCSRHCAIYLERK